MATSDTFESAPDETVAAIGRENVERVQDEMAASATDVLALTDVWSFNPLVFVPIYDLPIPRVVLVPGEGDPVLLAPHWGHRTVVESTWVPEDRIYEFAPYGQRADGQVPAGQGFEDVLGEALSGLQSTRTIGMDYPRTSHGDYELFDRLSVSVVDANPLLERALGPKTDGEIELIREAVRVAEAGVDAALDALEPGVTEFEIGAAAEHAMRQRGDRLFPYDYHYGAGPHSLQPARRISDRPVEAGETFDVDVLPLVNGYFADICRCAIVGDVEPTDEQRNLYETVLGAHDVIDETVADGVEASEVDRAIRKFFAEAGYDGKFLHHTGHGVGTEFGPDLTPGSGDVLRENHVVAIEPGLYVDGVGGVRIEDVFVVESDGATSLMEYPKDLL